jgi:hypothetical protein
MSLIPGAHTPWSPSTIAGKHGEKALHLSTVVPCHLYAHQANRSIITSSSDQYVCEPSTGISARRIRRQYEGRSFPYPNEGFGFCRVRQPADTVVDALPSYPAKSTHEQVTGRLMIDIEFPSTALLHTSTLPLMCSINTTLREFVVKSLISMRIATIGSR